MISKGPWLPGLICASVAANFYTVRMDARLRGLFKAGPNAMKNTIWVMT